MQVEATALPGVLILTPRRIGDARGFFAEVFRSDLFERAVGRPAAFVQDNHALSRAAFTVRGLHYQLPPSQQGKLVSCPRGRLLDVVVDLRRGSPTFGRHLAVELSAESGRQLWVPEGFAHGYCTLEPDTEVFYKVTAFYDAARDRGLAFDDPALGIPWPVPPEAALLSPRDRAQPRLSAIENPFVWEEVR